ncbi:MAG TPA: LysE family translocator [Candidatus Macondimonas sp.]|nr:LysE family translocator [Candidatus Macondimonas sp.]
MQLTLDLVTIAALFGAMALLALTPSMSVFAVTANAASGGFVPGAFTALGIVLGDLVFIFFAIFGLALLAENFGNLFFLLKYAGGLYLIWLGVSLWRSKRKEMKDVATTASSLMNSFMTGLLITISDQKALLFYLGFFPAFLDLAALTALDIGLVGLLSIIAVGGVKLGYAYAAARTRLKLGNRIGKRSSVLAASIMITIGTIMIMQGKSP